jgi:hypothetical protein
MVYSIKEYLYLLFFICSLIEVYRIRFVPLFGMFLPF